jgi:hypothetical protein
VRSLWTGLQTMAGWVTTVFDNVGKLFGAVSTNKTVMDTLRGVVDAIGTGFRLAFEAIGDFFGVLQNLWNFVQNNPVADVLGGIGDIVGGGKPPGKAAGGPVLGGSSYIVGENGPELFVPSVSGVVVPNGAGGGVSIGSVTIQAGSFSGSDSALRQTARKLFDHIEDEARRRGDAGIGS